MTKRPFAGRGAATQRHSHPSPTPNPKPLTSLGEEMSRHVAELSPDAIVIADAAGQIVYVNQQTESLFGYGRETLVGQPIEQLLPARFQTTHRRQRQHYVGTPHTRAMGSALDLVARRQDGGEFPVDVSLGPLHIGKDLFVISTIRDITARRWLEQRLRAEEQAHYNVLQTVLEDLPCGVMLVRGPEARLVLANQFMAQLWGAMWPVGQAMERFLAEAGIEILDSASHLLPPERWATLRATRHGRVTSQEEEYIRSAHGATVPIVVSTTILDPARLPSGGILTPSPEELSTEDNADPTPLDRMVLVAYHDISALKTTELLKDEFITLATDQLRNPLAIIQGYTQTLGQARPSRGKKAEVDWAAWQTEARDAILQATARLGQLTNELLEVSQVASNGLTLHLEPEDLVALTRRISARIQATTTRHQVRFASEAGQLVVLADQQRMERVLTHLLTNAIAYSPAGGQIVVTLREDRSEGLAELAVHDEGIGIPAAQQSQIFGRFVRAANAQHEGIPGAGLGLYLSRELIRRHGGRIWFRSVQGHGTTFTVVLPLHNEQG